ncbi:MAG: hypothetical protein K0U34_06645, partial [Alphaproteobacteria bacterium]|nr:hypothetical protein [Alphaproteobacteria bacterium]
AAFAAKTPARIVAVAFTTAVAEDWTAFRAAAEHFTDVLFVVSADVPQGATDTSPTYPAAFNLSNVLSVTTQNTPGADVAIAPGTQKTTQDGHTKSDFALARTIKTLVMCVPGTQTLAGPNTKLWALMGLGALVPSPEKPVTSPLHFKPCAAAGDAG